jgi:hypothetical protein
MGWTGTHVEKGGATREFERMLNCENENGKWEMLRGAWHGRNEFYAAVRRTIKATGESYVFAFVAMVRWSRDWYNFTYKDMDESCGPCIHNCPKTILDLLSPLEEHYKPEDRKEDGGYGWSKTWREACRENAKPRPKIKDGSIIRLTVEASFTNGHKGKVFLAKWSGRRLRFYPCDPETNTPYPFTPSYYYRLSRRILQKAEVIAEPIPKAA